MVDSTYLVKDGENYKSHDGISNFNLQTYVSLIESHMAGFPYEKVGEEVVLQFDTRSYTDEIYKKIILKFREFKASIDELQIENEKSTDF